jgi:hypothetical protein
MPAPKATKQVRPHRPASGEHFVEQGQLRIMTTIHVISDEYVFLSRVFMKNAG